MIESYGLSDFYVLLKLGLWKSGEVLNWGRIEKVLLIKNDAFDNISDVNYFAFRNKSLYLKKPLQFYLNRALPKKMIGRGVYLLDHYLLERKRHGEGEKQLKTYIIIISTTRFDFENREYTYILRVSNYLDEMDFTSIVVEGKRARKRKSYFRKKTSAGRSEFMPINARERKY